MTAKFCVMKYLCIVAAGLLIIYACGEPEDKRQKIPPEELRVMQDDFPRAFFFRAAEIPGKDSSIKYTDWELSFNRLMGIEGKVLDEEIPGISTRNISFFTKFKEAHPDQLVLLHFNGNARDPRFDAEEFFAGHWIYFNGATILEDVPAEDGETVIRVADASLFKTGVGRYKSKNEDIGLCELDEEGNPDWDRSEQVVLVSADRQNQTITVKRGAYNTRPRAFKANRSYAAAHAFEGPWGGEHSNLMWFYNFSDRCPVDNRGRTASDVLIEDLCNRFEQGGELALFDGIEFDVLFHENTYHPDLRRPGSRRGMDVDNDRRVDNAIFDGINTYGAGTVEFSRLLRSRFPADKMLLADGMNTNNQRAFGILNGIESEGFPRQSDITMKDWSGGLNRHFFWDQNGREPVFNYINHKSPSGIRTEVPFNIHRMVFAAGVFTNSAICYINMPVPEEGEEIGLWDELVMGTERKTGWLGRPLGDAVQMARTGEQLKFGHSFEGNVEVTRESEGYRIESADSNAGLTMFELKGIPLHGPDLFVTMTLRAAPLKGYPEEVARLMWVGVSSGERFMSWANMSDFSPIFYFSGLSGESTDLRFEIEGAGPVWISRLEAYAAPGAMYREFDHGVVLANPAPHPVTFDMGTLFPGASFRRLQGSSNQDTSTNDGSSAGTSLTLPSKDALFLIRN